MTPQWQPIETAPKDGKSILLWIVHPNAKLSSDPVKDGWAGWCRGRWSKFNGGGWTWDGFIGDPTHWQPLPPPPGEEPASRRRVQFGVIEFHSERLNPGLVKRFNAVTEDLRESASIVDIWLMDIATVLSEFGYSMEIYSTAQPADSTVMQDGEVRTKLALKPGCATSRFARKPKGGSREHSFSR